MAHGNDPDGVAAVGQLVHDAIGPNPQGTKSSQPPSELVSGFGLPLQEPERLPRGVSDLPVQVEDLATGGARQDYSRHLPAGWSSIQVPAKVRQGHGFPPLELAKPFFDRSQRLTIGEDLGRLLQGLVLVDRDQHRRRPASSRDDDVLPEIGHPVDHAGELAP